MTGTAIVVNVRDAALSPDGSRVAICVGDTTVAIYSVQRADVTLEEGSESGLAVRTFPNPVDDELTVELTLARAGQVRVRLFDMLGRELATLVDERMEAGPHAAYLDAGSLAPGSYLIIVQAGETQTTRRIAITR